MLLNRSALSRCNGDWQSDGAPQRSRGSLDLLLCGLHLPSVPLCPCAQVGCTDVIGQTLRFDLQGMTVSASCFCGRRMPIIKHSADEPFVGPLAARPLCSVYAVHHILQRRSQSATESFRTDRPGPHLRSTANTHTCGVGPTTTSHKQSPGLGSWYGIVRQCLAECRTGCCICDRFPVCPCVPKCSMMRPHCSVL